ncbi:hypothetical protein, partial [Dapis sp. BLCC M229]|uniref:hypothetical protein n=1 Tax=Dapis sp. BLCC M229 TaxID=3400188 RepID=UPI003CF915C1
FFQIHSISNFSHSKLRQFRLTSQDNRMGWMGYLTISNRPREEKNPFSQSYPLSEEVIINY